MLLYKTSFFREKSALNNLKTLIRMYFKTVCTLQHKICKDFVMLDLMMGWTCMRHHSHTLCYGCPLKFLKSWRAFAECPRHCQHQLQFCKCWLSSLLFWIQTLLFICLEWPLSIDRKVQAYIWAILSRPTQNCAQVFSMRIPPGKGWYCVCGRGAYFSEHSWSHGYA